MGTRKDRTALGRESKKAGGWGAAGDEQFHCPDCGKRCCGSELNERQVQKSMEAGLRARCKRQVCHRAAGWGTDHSGFGHCKFHFGATPAHRRTAARQEARTLMRTYGVPVDIDPEDALREEIHRTVGHVRWLAEKVASLGDDQVMDEGQPPVTVSSGGKRKAKVIDIKSANDPDADQGEDDYTEQLTSTDIVRVTPGGDEALVFGVTEREIQAGGEGGGFDRVKVAAAPNVWLQVYMAERRHLADVTKIAMAAGLESRRLDWAEGMADRLISAMEDLAAELGQDPTSPPVRLQIASTLERLTQQAS